MRSLVWLSILTIALVACGKTQPQRALFRGEKGVDTTAVQLLMLHQQMADKADAQLVKVAEEGYVLMDESYWVKGLEAKDQPTLCEGDFIDLKAEFYSLQGELIVTHQSSVQVGQVDEIRAIVYVLQQMHRAQQVSLLVPWYLAFGSAGNEAVPPYENLRVELTVQ